MEESKVETPFDAFTEDVREDIDGLVWLGYLEEQCTFCGHDFVLRTLRGDEELLAGLVMKEFTETLGQAKAHVWATVSIALLSVDGAEDFCPPATPNKRDWARARFNWITKNWYWPVGLFLFNKYSELLKRQQEALDALEDFCNGSPDMPLPGFGSWSDKASSEEVTEVEAPKEDIREYLDPEDPSTPSS